MKFAKVDNIRGIVLFLTYKIYRGPSEREKKNIHIVTYLLSIIQKSIFTWLMNMQKAGVMCILTPVCLLYTV